MTVKTRERLTWFFVSCLIIGGAVAYGRHWDLLGLHARYLDSEQRTQDAQEQLRTMEESLVTAKERAANMEKDPVEKEATVRRVSKGVRDDEIVFRVEEEAPAQK